MDDRWLSVEDIAEYLGDRKDTIYAGIDAKDNPARRLGRLWKFKPEEVDESVGREAPLAAGTPRTRF